jgi:hypothetical protein
VLFFPWYPAVMLAFEASNVIDLRLWKIAGGGHGAATEGHLMVKEKIDALFEAGSVLVDSGNPAAVIEIYRKHVAANAVRLGRAS